MSGEDKPTMPSAAIDPYDHQPFRAHHPTPTSDHTEVERKGERRKLAEVKLRRRGRVTQGNCIKREVKKES